MYSSLKTTRVAACLALWTLLVLTATQAQARDLLADYQ